MTLRDFEKKFTEPRFCYEDLLIALFMGTTLGALIVGVGFFVMGK